MLCVFKLKYDVNEFISGHFSERQLDYDYLWFDWNGSIILENVEIADLDQYDDRQLIANVEQIEIQFLTLSSLFSFNEYMTYQTFPESLVIRLNEGVTEARI